MNYHGTVAGSVLLAAITANLQLGYCLNTMEGRDTVCIDYCRTKGTSVNNRDFILGQLFAH